MESISKVAVNYIEMFKQEKFAINNEPTTLHLFVELNGIAMGSLTTPASSLASTQAVFDVSPLFREMAQRYNKAVSR